MGTFRQREHVMPGTDIADRYFACIKAKDIDGLLDLYADEATFTLPNGREFQGKDAIREMHLSVFAAGAPIPTTVMEVVGTDAIAVEIEARLPDGSVRRTANFYQISGDGRIARLGVYMRGD